VFNFRADAVEEFARYSEARIRMDGKSREAISSHHDRIFPNDFVARDNLIHRNHPSGDRAPDLQAVEGVDVLALVLWRAGDDRQKPVFPRKAAPYGATGLAIQTDGAAFEAGLQGLRHLDSRDTASSRLEVEHFRPNHHDRFTPVTPYRHRPAVVVQNVLCLIAQLT